jgi:hypothetical protein
MSEERNTKQYSHMGGKNTDLVMFLADIANAARFTSAITS